VLDYGMRNQLRNIAKTIFKSYLHYYDLDAERYTTATGDITIVERKDN
jgi:hypothetical protein